MFVYKYEPDDSTVDQWHIDPPSYEGRFMEVAMVVRVSDDGKGLIVQPLDRHARPILIDLPIGWPQPTEGPYEPPGIVYAVPAQPQKLYAYYRPRDEWFFLGEFTDREKAEKEVVRMVSKIGLRCLFRWNDRDEYTCKEGPEGVRGKLTTTMVDAKIILDRVRS